MALVLTTPPAVEPISLAEAKLHLRVDGNSEDAAIGRLIVAAREYAERVMSTALITQGWSLYLDQWPGPQVEIPKSPLIAISDVWVYGEDDVGAGIDPAHWFVDIASSPPRLVLRQGRSWPKPGRVANGIEIAFTAGFGAAAADVPGSIREGLLRLIAYWFENRGEADVPPPAQTPLSSYRSLRL